jgi:predicted nuclease of restriction endonuclease-like RecB superfamily
VRWSCLWRDFHKEMFKALIGLFQSSCVSQQMLLQNKLSTIPMTKTDNVVSYMAKIIELRDKLSTFSMKVEDKELVSIDLNGLLPS